MLSKAAMIFTPLIAIELLVIGQVATSPESIPGIAANFGGYGLLGWYLYYNTRHAIPRLMDKHETLVGKIVDDFRAEMQAERTENTATREAFREGMVKQQCHAELHPKQA